MNWQRIGRGTLIAGLVVFFLDGFINHVILIKSWLALHEQGYLLSVRPYTVPVFALQDFAIGFVLIWFYALARPRLGPGPRTALTTSTIAWFLLAVPTSLFQWLWLPIPGHITVTYLIGAFVQCYAATYLAGWQYIERAP